MLNENTIYLLLAIYIFLLSPVIYIRYIRPVLKRMRRRRFMGTSFSTNGWYTWR